MSQSESSEKSLQRELQTFHNLCADMSWIPNKDFVEYGSGDPSLFQRPTLMRAIEETGPGEILYPSRRDRLSSKASVLEEVRKQCTERHIELREPSSMGSVVKMSKLISDSSNAEELKVAFQKFVECIILSSELLSISAFGTLRFFDSGAKSEQTSSPFQIEFSPAPDIDDESALVTRVTLTPGLSTEQNSLLIDYFQRIKNKLCQRSSVNIEEFGTFEVYQILGSAEIDPNTNMTLSIVPTRRLVRLNVAQEFQPETYILRSKTK